MGHSRTCRVCSGGVTTLLLVKAGFIIEFVKRKRVRIFNTRHAAAAMSLLPVKVVAQSEQTQPRDTQALAKTV